MMKRKAWMNLTASSDKPKIKAMGYEVTCRMVVGPRDTSQEEVSDLLAYLEGTFGCAEVTRIETLED